MKYKIPKFRKLNYEEFKKWQKRNDITIASSLNEFTLGACQKNLSPADSAFSTACKKQGL